MPNSIPTTQNDILQLERLAAQRQLYSDAKAIQLWQILLSVPLVVLWSFVVLAVPSLRIYGAMWSISLTFLDILAFTPWQTSLKSKAAKIQELFDCTVLQIPWHDLKVGTSPDAELVAAAAQRDQKKNPNFAGLKDWYPVEAGSLSLPIGRIICQRANCWWDAALRKRESLLVVIVLITLSSLVVLLSVVGEFSMERFILTGLLPLMPIMSVGMRRFRDQREAADRADRLKDAAGRLWNLALSGQSSDEQLAHASRQLQDEIYEHRRRSPLIPNWLYQRLRKGHEEQMNKGARALADEVRTTGNVPTQPESNS